MGVREVAMATKFWLKIALSSSLQEIEKFIACTVGISELVNFNTLSEFLREPKLHKFPFLARNRGIFCMFSRVLWAS